MSENILFITGHLAEPRLKAVLSSMEADFKWSVLDIGVKVAALMTEEIVLRRLPEAGAADKIMLPGRCRADLDRLSAHYGVPVVRGPDEVKDIPVFFGRARKASDMSKYDISKPPRTTPTRAPTSSTWVACRIRRFRISKTRYGPSRHTATRSASIPPTRTSFCAAAKQAPTICSVSMSRGCRSPTRWPRSRC
jgi:hypothetical protein